MVEAEKSFVEKHCRLSKEYQEKVDTLRSLRKVKKEKGFDVDGDEGERLASDVRSVVAVLKKVKKEKGFDVDGDEDEEDAEIPKSGKATKSLLAKALLAKTLKSVPGFSSDETFGIDPIPPVYPKIKFKEFVEISRDEITDSEDAKFVSFVAKPLPAKVASGAAGEKIRDLKYDKASVVTFIRDNGHDVSEPADVAFSAIMCCLVDKGAISPNDPATVPEVVDQTAPDRNTLLRSDVDKVITDGKLVAYAGYARRVMDASFYYASQPAMDGSLAWFGSFTKVFGKLISERRFINLCELIVMSGSLRKYIKHLRISSVLKANDVLKYRLIRISTPQLIFRALKMVTNDFVFRMVDPLELTEYYRFLKGGVLAQIAAGPLKEYLEGVYDPTAYNEIPDRYFIGDLMSIKEPPYFERIIKQAKIIFDVHGTNVGKWYQGERAYSNLDTQDVFFREIVRAIKVVDGERVKAIAEAIAAEMNIGDLGNDDNVGAVKALLMTANVKLPVGPLVE